ncbi:hypothetical protein [Microtetraspora malaysiensis]
MRGGDPGPYRLADDYPNAIGTTRGTLTEEDIATFERDLSIAARV